MSTFDLISRLGCLQDAAFVPVGDLQDLLLDIRNEVPSPYLRAVVDRDLASTRRRSWFSTDEASPLLRELTSLLVRLDRSSAVVSR